MSDHEIEVTEEQARAALIQYFRLADELPMFPATTEVAVKICRAAGFDVTASRLRDWANRGLLDHKKRWGEKPVWSALGIVSACQAADRRRLWIFGDRRHDHRWTQAERDFHTASAAERREMFKQVEHLDLEDLVTLAVCYENPEIRIGLLLACRDRLKQIETIAEAVDEIETADAESQELQS